MKKFVLLPILLCAFIKIDYKPLPIGSMMPLGGTTLLNVMNDKYVSLGDAMKTKGLLVIFSCNTCPFVIANQDRIHKIEKLAQELQIGTVIINSNEGLRDSVDSKEAMRNYGNDHKFLSPYLLDVNSLFADKFGATRTPECFLFDSSSLLAYQGAIDDSPRDPKKVKTQYLKDAMTALAKGQQIKVKTTVSGGCTIKRKPAPATTPSSASGGN